MRTARLFRDDRLALHLDHDDRSPWAEKADSALFSYRSDGFCWHSGGALRDFERDCGICGATIGLKGPEGSR